MSPGVSSMVNRFVCQRDPAPVGPNQIDVRSDLHAGRVTVFVPIGFEAKDKSVDHAMNIKTSATQPISVIRS
jgi:hypothetical protein